MADAEKGLDKEKEALIAEIHAAFKGVTREGGVSWSESEVLDRLGSMAERERAQAGDTDAQWEQLVDDESWTVYPGVGGFHFVDKISFRYYLPVAMLKCIASSEDEGLAFVLTMRYPGDRRVLGERWSLLDERQRRTVARFLGYMAAVARRADDEITERDWTQAYESHWSQFG